MDSSEDWQETAFNTRHMHNRSSRNSRSKRAPPAFDVHKSLGTYEVKCPAWTKLHPSGTAALELYRLSENGLGVVGEIVLEGALRASVVLAGSRVGLGRCVGSWEDDGEEKKGEDSEEEEEEEEDEADRFETFEKNSFRSPKFWIAWCGTVTPSPSSSTTSTTSSSDTPVSPSPPTGSSKSKAKSKANPTSENDDKTGLAYIVFSSADCRKFKGTLNVAELGWKDVAVTGFKVAGRKSVDVPVEWRGVEM